MSREAARSRAAGSRSPGFAVPRAISARTFAATCSKSGVGDEGSIRNSTTRAYSSSWHRTSTNLIHPLGRVIVTIADRGNVPTTPSPVQSRRVAWASLVGTSLESYDFYVFAYFSAFFAGPLFFEPLGPVGGTLSAFLAIAAGFVIRPVGAIVFGHLGDRIGRRKTLLWTIAIMGIATGLIGLLPTYAVAGWFGAIMLVIFRLI